MLYRSSAIALIALSIAVGLVSMAVTALVTMAVLRLGRRKGPSETPDAGELAGRGWAAALTSRTALVAFPFGFALAFYAILDWALSVSVYWWFAAIYALFWVLVLLLLLWQAPARHKLLILGSVSIVVLSLRFVDWNSRKPFLRDLYRVREGMTATQVEEIMGGYMAGGGVPTGSPGIRLDGRLLEQGGQATGTISYRHTNEGWGDSDWGVVTFEKGRVVGVHFSPD